MAAAAAPEPGTLVLPGQLLSVAGSVDVGPGLRRAPDGLLVVQPGQLRHRAPATYWVDAGGRRYVPARGHCVLGTVLQRAGDLFRVDIGAAEPATLSFLSFEGVTKKNRPAVAAGDLLLARLLVASRDMEPELVCVNSQGKADGLGVLPADGLDFSVPLRLARRLLAPDCPLLRQLGAQLRFELAVGMNGRVWVRSSDPRQAVAAAAAICASEYMDDRQTAALCKDVAAAVRRADQPTSSDQALQSDA